MITLAFGATIIGTIAAVTMAAASVAGTAYSVVAGQDAKKKQAEAVRKQEQAQKEAAGQAQAQQRRSQQAMNAANRREPDVSGIMAGAGKAATTGPSSTMLTGPGGVDPTQLSLGRNTLLGG
jgi:transcription initiation factor TFIID subunit TAF12